VVIFAFASIAYNNMMSYSVFSRNFFLPEIVNILCNHKPEVIIPLEVIMWVVNNIKMSFTGGAVLDFFH